MGLRITSDRADPAAFGQLQRPTPPPPEETTGAQAPQDPDQAPPPEETAGVRAAEEVDETEEEQEAARADRFPAPPGRQQATTGAGPQGLPGANLDLFA